MAKLLTSHGFFYMTNYEKAEYYRLNSEAWCLFYESFHQSTNAILNCRGIIVDMQSEIIKASISNPKNTKLKASQERIDLLSENLNVVEKLNNRCVNQQKLLKEYKNRINQLESEMEEIKRQEREGLSV